MTEVLITGASGGFGHEFARQLEAMGYDLILHGRDEAKLARVLASLKNPERHWCVTADLDSSTGVAKLLDRLAGHTIHGLVNNAGFGLWGKFEQRGQDEQLQVIATDLDAPISLSHSLLPQLIAQHGFIINVSSLAGEYPLPFMSSYAAAKAGLTYWSEAVRIELKGRIRVVTLVPGPSPTGFRDVSGMASGPGSFFRTSAETIVAACLRTLNSGGGYCVPGWRHRLLWALQKTVPRRVGLHIMARKLGGADY